MTCSQIQAIKGMYDKHLVWGDSNMNWKYEDGRIYGTDEKGELMCETTFVRKGNGELDIDHTYVNAILRGQGMAGKMMVVVAEYLREKSLKASATCSYANIWLKRHEAVSYTHLTLPTKRI